MKAFDNVVHIQNHYHLPGISVEFSKQQGCEWRTSECSSGPLKLTSASGIDVTAPGLPEFEKYLDNAQAYDVILGVVL